jgi:hypothetical protein
MPLCKKKKKKKRKEKKIWREEWRVSKEIRGRRNNKERECGKK